jgi:hypothetical protein
MIRPYARRHPWRWRGIDRGECDHRRARRVEGVRPRPPTLPRSPKRRQIALPARLELESAAAIARQPTPKAREAARRCFSGESFDDDRPNDDFDEISSDGPPLPLIPWNPSAEEEAAFRKYLDDDHSGSSAGDVLAERHGYR